MNPDAAASFSLAQSHHQAGRLHEACAFYRQILEEQPDHADAMLFLGLAEHQMGHADIAVELMRKAIAINPYAPYFHCNLAVALTSLGDLEGAAEAYRQAIGLKPDYAEAYHNLGIILRDQGEQAAAADNYRLAIQFRPGFAQAHNGLGNVLRELGHVAEAIECFRRALALAPDTAATHSNLGSALKDLGQLDAATDHFRCALRLKPDFAAALNNLGQVLKMQGRQGEALEHFQRAAAADPDLAEARLNLGVTLRELHRTEEAIASLKDALRVDPDLIEAQFLLAVLGASPAPISAPSDYVARLFDGYADNFDQHLQNKLEYRTPECLNRIVRTLVGSKVAMLDMLDLGCGTGLCGPLFRDLARTLDGVDLSEKMLDKARERNVYDILKKDDVTATLRGVVAGYDLVLAADVFVYMGHLEDVFDACRGALRPGGLFAFSVETAEDEAATCVLRSTGRYAHSAAYIRALGSASGMGELHMERTMLRKDGGNPVGGFLFVFEKTR